MRPVCELIVSSAQDSFLVERVVVVVVVVNNG